MPTKSKVKTKKPPPPRRRQCGAMIVHSRLLEQYPNFRQNLVNIEQQVTQRLMMGLVAKVGGPTTIPVVVHVIFNPAAENISTAQIKSQITSLNKDYSAKNPDRNQTPAVWKGLIADPVNKAKSLVLTDEGLRRSEELFRALFTRPAP